MFTGKLKKFQEKPCARMLNRKRILNASIMGSGKTAMALYCAEYLMERGYIDKCIVICLSTLREQWVERIHQFTDSKVLMVDGDRENRERKINKFRQKKFKYLVLHYETLVDSSRKAKKKDLTSLEVSEEFRSKASSIWDILDEVGRDRVAVVCDEAMRIKNWTSKTTRMVKTITGRWMWALNATPIENRPEELYSVMEWLNRNILGSVTSFRHRYIVTKGHFGQVVGYQNLKELHQKVAPHMIRLTRKEIGDELPALRFKDYKTDLSASAERLYNTVATDLIATIEGFPDTGAPLIFYDPATNEAKGASKEMALVAQKYMVLRQICQSPEILFESEGDYARFLIDKGLVANGAGAKLGVALDIIEEVLADDPLNKIVVFNYFKGFLRMLQKGLDERDIKAKIYSGDIKKGSERAALQEDFNNNPKTRVLLCSDAGGYGVDLPAGSHLLNTDLPWHPGKFDQRIRINRVSSKFKTNYIMTLTCRNTIEDRMYEGIKNKRHISDVTLDGAKTDKALFVLNKQSLLRFLKGE